MLGIKRSRLKEEKEKEECKRGMVREAVQGVVIGVHITFAYARKLVAVQLLVPASRKNSMHCFDPEGSCNGAIHLTKKSSVIPSTV